MKSKNLYLIRHGKAEDHSLLKRDYERNLVEKGRYKSLTIATKLKDDLSSNNLLIISSTANRALQTAEIFCQKIAYPIQDIQLEKSIYEAYHTEILKVINLVNNDIDNIIVVGHNPGLSDLANYLCESCINLNTSHVAKIILPEGFNFSEVSGGTCHLETVITG
ncbi:MAG: SixA phosphatase family protein [Sphingobacterium composti]|uniref:SixA phosphatase family protein n=1 Tax=Sphingobacterium composti TaxID=363260 RepID=UPI0013587594|nr:histidine phosphatase family protein [Sphingobacterium composti Ten et al. 2007 non Yoo et al. 2007]